jgi:mono/diheme cytochrome c family protein
MSKFSYTFALGALVAFAQPVKAGQPEFDPALIATGTTLYMEHCSVCHGVEADGKGPLASGFLPRPRNFTVGNFKLRSTEVGEPPSTADLERTIKHGIQGSYGRTMPAFESLSQQDVAALIEVIRYVAGVDQLGKPVAVPPRPARSDLKLGEQLYSELTCLDCHGEAGDGQGILAKTLKDANGDPIQPADFRTGQFKGGNSPEDIWTRVYAGLEGTPMPAFGRNSTADEIWAVTEYIMKFSAQK